MEKKRIFRYIPKFIVPKKGQNKKLIVEDFGGDLKLSCSKCRKKIILPKVLDLMLDDYVAIGLYLAEGHTYLNLDREYHHDGEVTFTNSNMIALKLYLNFMKKFNILSDYFSWYVELNINLKDKVAVDKLISYWIKNLGLSKKKIRKADVIYTGSLGGPINSNTSLFGCVRLCFSSVIFRNFFLNFISKVLEEELMNKNKDALVYLLSGYFAGDGHVQFKVKPVRRCIDICCNNLILLEKLKKALVIIGLSNLKETFPETTLSHNKSIRIYNRSDFFILDKYNIPKLIEYKQKKFKELMDSYAVGGICTPDPSLSQ